MTRAPQETALALEHVAAVARGSVLLAGFAGEQLPRALLDAGATHVTVFVQDLRAFRSTEHAGDDAIDVRFGPWPSASFLWAGTGHPPPFDAALVLLPKETARLRMLLAAIRPALRDGAPVAVVGRNDAGIRPSGRHLTEAVGEPRTLGYGHHCRAVAAEATVAARAFEPRRWREVFEADGLRGCSYPGVFSHGRLDEGTAMLLEVLTLPRDARALDVGCGSGVIAARAAGLVTGKVHGVDPDALAVVATGCTAAVNGLGDRIAAWPSDVLADVSERYTHMLSNPPFHAGKRTTHGVATRLIRDAPERLERDGELWLVANRFLPYADVLAEAFGGVSVAAESRRYRVWRAQEPRRARRTATT